MLGRSAVSRTAEPSLQGRRLAGSRQMLKIEIDRVKGRLYPITIVTLLLGCAPTQERVFAKAGVPEDQIAADTAECRTIARGLVPDTVSMVGTSPYFVGTSPYFASVGALNQSAALDQNRKAATIDCMTARGYQMQMRPLSR
jgi:hypothetical protein